MLRLDQVLVIRHKARVEGLSARRIAREVGVSRRTVRKYLKLPEPVYSLSASRRTAVFEHAEKLPSEPRRWRTRCDPFSEVWAEIEPLIERDIGLQVKKLFEELQRRYPGQFHEGQLRTLQRRFRDWRSRHEPDKDYFSTHHFAVAFPRRHQVCERLVARMEALYQEWPERTSRNQSITVARLHGALLEEGYEVGVTVVQEWVDERRREAEFAHMSKRTRKEIMAALWTLRLLQGGVDEEELNRTLQRPLQSEDARTLLSCIRDERLSVRNRAVAVLASAYGVPKEIISTVLLVSTRTVRTYVTKFEQGGVDGLLQRQRARLCKHADPNYRAALFKILHSPPASHGLNRTTWRMTDLTRVMKENGTPASQDVIRTMLRQAGYGFRKARVVLTSTDPEYKEKLEQITDILSGLKPNEKFFSVDEFGPFTIKTRGGKSLMLRGHTKTVPQNQKSRGSLIIVAALELCTNQITHFYARKKDTDEMVKLLEVLLTDYADQGCIYFSWDAASWHASKKLYEKVDQVNSAEYREIHPGPLVRLAPLPSGAQFLNVIESVFSGMARAILHNSDYGSVMEAVIAIDRHFEERNVHYRENPKRAGKKIWGQERVIPEFNESNNCKDPRYR